jgi:predicted RecA/RadA family phage recombinase
MERAERIVRASIPTAVAAALSFMGVVAIVFPITALADAVLGSPLGARVLVASAVAGAVGAGAFVARDASLARFAKFIGVTYATSFGWLVAVGAAMSIAGVAIPAGDRTPFLYAGLLALATAYSVAYGDRVAVSFESGDASTFGSSS